MRKTIVPGFILFLFLSAITFVMTGPSCQTEAATTASALQATAR